MKSLFKHSLDYLGIGVSTICAIHCLVTPFLIMALPMAGLAFLESEGVELGLIVVSFVIAIASLVFSYLRKHRNLKPIILACIGFMFFLLAKKLHIEGVESVEIILSIIGGSFVVVAHIVNLKLLKQAV